MVDKKKIERLLKTYFSSMEFTIDPDGYVNVIGNCVLDKYVKSLPVKFRHVSGEFDCFNSGLTTLIGSPDVVEGNFICSHNQLTSLEGAPQSIGAYFNCRGNVLTSLDGLSESFKGKIFLNYDPDLPILRLLRCIDIKFFFMDESSPKTGIVGILNKYCGANFSRSNILQCQKELIQNGYEGNASW
jgi:hypothetical protein